MRGKPKKPDRQGGRRVQLHRALSKLGWGSRTVAWGLIRAGQVAVDGRTVTDPLTWVDLRRQRITRAGESLDPPGPPPPPPRRVVLLVNKPRGVVVTRRDERGRRTVYDLLPAGLPWVFPVGRLDAASEGLMLVTNDRELAVRLTEPGQGVPKTYRVTARGPLTAAQLEALRRGPVLADGPTRPCAVRVLADRGDATELEVVLTEGRNRQARRMLAAVGSRVRRLVRVAVGELHLGELRPGEVRELSEEEIERAGQGRGEEES